ncbi:hypothetical protein F4802DRAFT_598283 [Xylaria palmicola]|nr:hypothetical protein F4802DRAFT_598283 [Xylaria palmicola]
MPYKSYNEQGHPHLAPIQRDLLAATGEFVGTFWFLFFAYSGQLMVVDQAESTGAVMDGFSLLVSVWSMYRISGGFFNPAVRMPVLCFSPEKYFATP